MPASLATLTNITKEIYEGDIREQLNNDVLTLRRIEKTSRGTTKVGGRYVTFPIHTKRNAGIGARLELEQLPSAGQQGHESARVNLRYLYGAVQLSGQAIKLIDEDYQAFQSSMEIELNGIKRDLARDMNRQVYGTGNGAIATLTAVAAAATTISVDRADLVDVGMVVDFVEAGAVENAALTVLDVDTAAGTIELSAAVSGAAGAGYITRAGGSDVGGQREWTGLGAIVGDTGTLYNINSATVPVWRSVINDNGGTPTAVSETMFTKMADDIRSNGGNTSVIFTSLGVRRAYANLLTQQRQFVNTKEFTGGFGGIAFITDKGEIPIVTDVYAPPSTAWFLNEKELTLYRENDWEFMDMDGSKWARVPGFDAYSGTLYQYSELGTGRRNTHGKIENIIEA